MKKRNFTAILMVLSISVLFLSGCNSSKDVKPQPFSSVSSQSKTESSFAESEFQKSQLQNSGIAEIKSELEQILEKDNIEGSMRFFAYLLENHREAGQLLDDEKDSIPFRFQHILNVFNGFEKNGLQTVEIEVIAYAPMDMEQFSVESHVSYEYANGRAFLYEIDVAVHDGGMIRLPMGKAKWIGSFTDDYPYINFILPYEDAVNRIEADTKYYEEITMRTELEAILLPAFSTSEEIPIDTLIRYLFWMGGNFIDEDGYYGSVLTQEQIDNLAKKYLDLTHVDGKETEYYIEERDFYYGWMGGFEGPKVADVLKVEKDGDATYVYYDGNGYSSNGLMQADFSKDWYPNGMDDRKITKFTYIGACLKSVEVISNPGFRAIIFTGENGG